jgi:methyl coenzyme M reductase gamma subunit
VVYLAAPAAPYSRREKVALRRRGNDTNPAASGRRRVGSPGPEARRGE